MQVNKVVINQFITAQRLSTYADLNEYEENLLLSKKSYIPLSILEVALRNSIDRLLVQKVGEKWHEDFDFLTKDSKYKVQQAKELLQRRREPINREKIIAELSFGFWVNLFKKPYNKKLRINDLKKIFPNLPLRQKKMINREIIYRELNHIRNFRNRIFHYEKVINKDIYRNIFKDIDTILNYFDHNLSTFSKRLNNE